MNLMEVHQALYKVCEEERDRDKESDILSEKIEKTKNVQDERKNKIECLCMYVCKYV